MELLRAADILIEKIKKDYREDVAIVVLMGSYIYNATHSKSDLDMYYVVNNERGCKPGIACIINGVGFDFWPISWERLERIANHDERITSIITEGKVVYYSSKEDLKRFNELKAKALDVSDKPRFTHKALAKLDETYKTYFKLLKAQNLSEARMYAMGVISNLTYATALLNRITVKRGRGRLKKEVLSMPLVPKDFSSLYDTVFISSNLEEIKNAYGQLINNTEELILKVQTIQEEPDSFAHRLTGFYEELINFYNKIYHACEIGDTCTALFAAVELTHEIEEAFSGTGVSPKQLPDIVGAFNPQNTERFVELTHKHEAKFVELLQSKDVQLKVFRNFDELEEYMKLL